MNKKTTYLIITVLLCLGGELCFGQDATPVKSSTKNAEPVQVQMQEKTKSTLALERVEKRYKAESSDQAKVTEAESYQRGSSDAEYKKLENVEKVAKSEKEEDKTEPKLPLNSKGTKWETKSEK